MAWYSWILFLHIIAASGFVFTMILMQLFVSRLMKKIPESEGKSEAKKLIQTRLHPIVDAVILTVGITGALLVWITWPMALNSGELIFKIAFALISLTAAYTGHFVLRPLKKKWTRENNHGALQMAARISPIIDRTALIAGAIAALAGWAFNHL